MILRPLWNSLRRNDVSLLDDQARASNALFLLRAGDSFQQKPSQSLGPRPLVTSLFNNWMTARVWEVGLRPQAQRKLFSNEL